MGSKWYADVHDIVKKSFFQLNLGGIVFPMTDILIYKYKKKIIIIYFVVYKTPIKFIVILVCKFL